MKRLFSDFYIEPKILFHCSYVLSKERNLLKTCFINPTKFFLSSFGTIEFDRYFSDPCNTNVKNVSFLSLGICDLAKIKHDNMNQMIGLKEIFVLPSSKLFAGSPKLRECFLLGKGNNVNMNHKETNEQTKIKDYWNYHVHPPSVLPRLFSGKQKSWTTFLKGREDDETVPRTSTLTNSSKHR